jgi:SNF2 family DNA or RNA helicase
MLRLIQETVDAAGLGSCHIDGSTRDRAAQVTAFQNDPAKRVFLISLKAGGYGLNLTKADTVIHFDPWWNPAVEAQATDRAHRIGQERPVTVYKLITTGTVEEKILKLQEKKRGLMDAALDDEAPLMEGLTDDDLRSLLT